MDKKEVFKRKSTPWNKGVKGYRIAYPAQRKAKGSLSIGHKTAIALAVPCAELHSSWKGDKVGYKALHEWVYKQLGNPSKCQNCRITTAKRFEWANKSGRYLRNISDWLRLCTCCHRKHDKALKDELIQKAEELKQEADKL